MRNQEPGRYPYVARMGCGVLLVVFGGGLTGGALLDLGKQGSVLGELVLLLSFGVAPLVAGVGLITATWRADRRRRQEEIEREVLRLAQEWGGVVSPLRVAAETDLSFDEAKRYLDRLADQGHVTLEPSDAGLVYRFPNAPPQNRA
ncbi:MAG: hypothetical protein QHJ73_05425 [Armatimonadota bacterium]|nr:hypothetical protein [Armatimonadota bacterium]